MTKIAILSSSAPRSPRVLADSLHQLLKTTNTFSEVFYRIDALKRLLKYNDVKHKYKFHLWFGYKLWYFFKDRILVERLKSFDAIVICDCIPGAFLQSAYSVENLRKKLGNTPILFYEVFYLGNAPTQILKLQSINAMSIERYDWHLAVAEVTEIRQVPSAPWSQIGIYLRSTGLKPKTKGKFMAIVDFLQPGFEDFRNMQIQILKDLKIPYISLEGSYTFTEIRAIYMSATFYFMQSMEAFGLPIAECLCCGSYIFTPDSSWPMSWRLDENPQIHGSGILPECFVTYTGNQDLKIKLQNVMKTYELDATPQKVFDIFYTNYPTYYDGNKTAIEELLKKIERKELNN